MIRGGVEVCWLLILWSTFQRGDGDGIIRERNIESDEEQQEKLPAGVVRRNRIEIEIRVGERGRARYRNNRSEVKKGSCVNDGFWV
jgi:hypothetical protein